jgi:hypothetical protein
MESDESGDEEIKDVEGDSPCLLQDAVPTDYGKAQ